MNDMITKSATVDKLEVTNEELTLINQHTIEDLTQEQVFVFKVAICDNEIDRDFEVFPHASLMKMADLFVGKTIMKDHRIQTDNQVARIYATEVVEGTGVTKNDENYAQLIAYCYMVKTNSNQDLITEIQAGIKKEVSVGCGIGKAICSICGADNRKAYCKHWNGQEYDSKQCFFQLLDPLDGYEVSFVAVPSQPKAGVIKSYNGKGESLPIQTDKEVDKGKEDLIDTEIGMIKSFLFTQKERGLFL